MKDSRCKVCGRDVTGLPSVFNLGWWYCYEHWDKGVASTGGACDTFNSATEYVIDLPDQPSGPVGPFTSKQTASAYADSTYCGAPLLRHELNEYGVPIHDDDAWLADRAQNF